MQESHDLRDQAQRLGVALKHLGMRQNRQIPFWDQVLKKSDGECWEWVGAETANGYGKFSYGGRSVRAHRHSWELSNGPIPDGRFVLHTCDNRLCVNPLHLYTGTKSDNMRDAWARTRVRFPRTSGIRADAGPGRIPSP